MNSILIQNIILMIYSHQSRVSAGKQIQIYGTQQINDFGDQNSVFTVNIKGWKQNRCLQKSLWWTWKSCCQSRTLNPEWTFCTKLKWLVVLFSFVLLKVFTKHALELHIKFLHSSSWRSYYSVDTNSEAQWSTMLFVHLLLRQEAGSISCRLLASLPICT